MSVEQTDRPQDLRERILDATLQVIRERGMARTRTSAIAQAAGCAEGSIYRYFSGKPELLDEVVRTHLPGLFELLDPTLSGHAGTATVRANLLAAAEVATSFYRDVASLLAGTVGESELSERADIGFQRAVDAIGAYLQAEQRLGRVRRGADPELSARLLLSGCLGESFRRDRRLSELVGLVARELESR